MSKPSASMIQSKQSKIEVELGEKYLLIQGAKVNLICLGVCPDL
jgi:hypothetical protein